MVSNKVPRNDNWEYRRVWCNFYRAWDVQAWSKLAKKWVHVGYEKE